MYTMKTACEKTGLSYETLKFYSIKKSLRKAEGFFMA